MSKLFHGLASVTANTRLARATYSIRLHVPQLAQAIRPGQFRFGHDGLELL